MEERRLLLAIALSLLALTAYQLLFPTAPRAPQPTPGPSGAPAATATAVPSLAPTAAPSASPTGRPTAATAAPRASVSDAREHRVEVHNPDLTVAFSNRGARLLSWRLERFKDPSGHPEEMVQALPEGPRSLDLETGDAQVDGRLREALFRPSADELVVNPTGTSELRFDYAEGDLEARKVLRFPAQGYLVEVQAAVRRAGTDLPVRVVWGPSLGNPTAAEKEVQGYQAPHAVLLLGGQVERVPAEKIGPQRAIPSPRWLGIESTYFVALWVPGSYDRPTEIRAVPMPSTDQGKAVLGPLAAVTLGGDASSLLYVGPKDYYALSDLDHELARVVPVGEWIGPIVVPFMALLRWVHARVGSYGWSIVVLTVLINLAMAPLRHYSIANGLKMAKLSPEMRVIQERYRKVPLMDPRRQDMQQEIAELYARHGMSMSTQMTVGCLPILLTMPFLIAFYRVLSVSIDLRGASFMWIPDLSQKDPYFITPVLMGASMFLMQRMVPSGLDPAQQKMMLIMPVILSGMFLWAPSGLNLYWLASNLCSIVQQTVTLRIVRSREGTPPPRKGEARKPAR